MKTLKITRPIQGIILINKPSLLSSNTVLQHIKRLFFAAKAGHMGSLDPLATGMLPICFGDATKFAQYGLEADKCYRVTARFGITTTTGDAQGEMVSVHTDISLLAHELQAIIPSFEGESLQIPPMYSALKHQGKKLYELARAGIEIERQARSITIYHIELIRLESPYAEFKVHCSKGTYIRTLIEDIGRRLGMGAHVTQLHRVFTAGFERERMYSVEELQAFTQEERMQ
ncbi:MAG TPA: tRNA pseudouridine(55) synthase TruB, partial [Legionellaceae bacterium]|nr:tRNA pseudouridine(55) synthase TruB [Legionellaceae bacterium]